MQSKFTVGKGIIKYRLSLNYGPFWLRFRLMQKLYWIFSGINFTFLQNYIIWQILAIGHDILVPVDKHDNDAWPFCKVSLKLMHPFKSYRSETKSVTPWTPTTTTTPPESWSLCVDLASQPTQKWLCLCKRYVLLICPVNSRINKK